jgi:hypothetical protein
MEQFTPESAVDLQQNAFFFKKNDYKIHIFKQELNRFAEQFRERFEQSSSTGISQRKEVNAPQVFICHVNEDKEYAANLYNKFEGAGLKPWLDKENLRGGDHWDKHIRRTIKKVDYFIVLQSNALAKKQIGYVNREINIALDRQEEFRRNIRFIIPVEIEECQRLEELEHLQAIDLTEEGNVMKLISIIKRDFEKRGN